MYDLFCLFIILLNLNLCYILRDEAQGISVGSFNHRVMNKLEDPLSSALSFIGKFIIGARTLHVQNLTQYGLAVSLAYLSGEEGVISSFKK